MLQKVLFGIVLSVLAVGAQATTYNLNLLLTNSGFESGLTSWTYSGATVNSNTYLTSGEWSAQNWSSSSPFYSDAQLALLYPGTPWGANPSITHIDQSTISGDPTTVIGAAVGSGFVGSRQDGYQGHCLTGGSACGAATAYYDTNFQLQQSLAGAFLNGDVFTVTLWANRGRLNDDWSQQNASTSGAASLARVRLERSGNINGTSFTSISTQDFTNWSADGQWASQTFSWTLGTNLTGTNPGVRFSITGINQNHDRYIAIDMGAQQVVPLPAAAWLMGGALAGLGALKRRQARA